jgi:hypothetical protein
MRVVVRERINDVHRFANEFEMLAKVRMRIDRFQTLCAQLLFMFME